MEKDKILRVTRSKEQAKASYDKISKFYDYFAGLFERTFRDKALKQLAVKAGESVLEIGFGTGLSLLQIAELVGEGGQAYGVDLSSGMLNVTKERLEKAGLSERVELYCADAVSLPFNDSKFDAVFMSFTLELFDTPEIPKVLKEAGRVLKPNGRLGVVSMSKEGDSAPLRLYEWLHEKLPQYVDCRPIYVESSIKDAGFTVESCEKVKLFSLPGEIVVARKADIGAV